MVCRVPEAFGSDLSEFKVLSYLESDVFSFDQYFMIRASDGDFVNYNDLKCQF